MNATYALTKYAWTRYRIFLLLLFSALLVSAIFTPLLWISRAPMWLARMTASVGYLALLSGLFGSLALFGFSRKSSLLDPTSGYDPWLLRQPIVNWKLAIIPAGLITAWISMLWAIVLLIVQMFGGQDIPPFALVIVPQSLGMSACAIAMCSLVWMPFRAAWLRIALLIVAIPMLYFVGLGAMIVFASIPEWMPWAAFGIVACYIASIAIAYSSVKLARVAAFQQTDSQQTGSQQSKFTTAAACDRAVAATSRSFPGCVDALDWYDSKRSRATKLRQVLMISPVIAILIFLVPFSSVTAIITLMFVTIIVGWTVSARFEPTVWGARSSLPSYLIASPLPTRTIAWVRLRAYLREYPAAIGVMTLLWMTCFIWPSNRVAASQWWTQLAADSASSLTPLRIVVAIYLAILVTMLGLTLRQGCVLLRGRQSLVLWTIGVVCMASIVTLISCLSWFMQQGDWEHVRRSLDDWLQWSYQLFYLAIVAKLLFDASVVWLASKNMFSWRELASGITGWCVAVVLAAVAWYALWPLGGVRFVTVLMATSLAIPLSVWFAGPLAVRANRHHQVT
ncbi:hypothetical protein [Allorhodopirellula solitaria]|uniref:Uncharacterized protein n=1 Tax=Allorhodopirellula solitaria TaxID=2527987 RepID=A0A5C5WYA6_9BACT|nr:hypothetical protein [Allorhodopirellula solitaria]TWT55667.1 hypothetical protein CA85_48610 [Allorhodopirellula solitaria]